MKVSSPLFYRSSLELAKMIDWSKHAGKRYVVRDPTNENSIQYLDSAQYLTLQAVCLSTNTTLEVIAAPHEDKDYMVLKFPGIYGDIPKSPLGLPKLPRVRLFNLISGWKLTGSMIEFKRNFDFFFIHYVRNICSYMNIRFSSSIYKSSQKFGLFMERIRLYRGINQCIIRLKVSSIVVLHYISGNPVHSTNDLGQRIRLVNGLPAMLPAHFRALIRSKSVEHQRVILSLLHTFKGIQGKYKAPDLSSITAPKFFKPIKGEEDLFALSDKFQKYMPFDMLSDNSEVLKTRSLFWRVYNRFNVKLNLEIDPENLPIILKAGPNCPVAFLGAAVDAVAHFNQGTKSPLLKFIHYVISRNDEMSMFSASSTFKRVLDIMGKLATDSIKSVRPKTKEISTINLDTINKANEWNHIFINKGKSGLNRVRDPIRTSFEEGSLEYLISNPSKIKLGKLALKYEAAGKVRVFAISDYWTQIFMGPIHQSMFKFLEKLPMDATFDQLGSVERFMQTPHTYIASFDLKSATDLIPQSLYIDVLQPWFDPSGLRPELSKLWMDVLVKRDFDFKGINYKYSRGQPMGTLSSWASLAIIHHYLVFLAALRVNLVSFGDYLVLGDDIVIGNKVVADSYLNVCKDYGITVGLPKSFQSNNAFFQFASQDILGQTNLSPVSLKEILSITAVEYQFKKLKATVALGPRVEFVNRLIRKGFVKNNNIFSLLRATMSYRDWRSVSQHLSKGKVPFKLMPIIVSLLTSNVKLEDNKFSISQLMGSLRGDINMLTGVKEISLQEQNTFLSMVIDNLAASFEEQVQLSMEKVTKLGNQDTLSNHPLGMIFSDSIGTRTSRYLLDIIKIRKEWSSLMDNLLADIEHNKIVYLLWDENSPYLDAHISYVNVHKIFSLIKSLERIEADIDLLDTALDTIKSGHNPSKAKTFMAFAAKYGERGPSTW